MPKHLRLYLFFGILVGLCSCILLSAQNTIHVPADKPTIQAAMDAANNGDTVLVAPGTYHETVNFNGKGITLASTDGVDTTILDGGGTIPLVYIGSVDPNHLATLRGFTIRNGLYAQSVTFMGQNIVVGLNTGGAVMAFAPSVISANKITDNETCGVYVWSGQVTVDSNSILRNAATRTSGIDCRSFGHGIYLFGASPLRDAHGAPYPFDGPTSIRNNTISDNAASGITGVLSAAVTIERNVIQNNQANGISAVVSGSYTVSGNVISGNHGTGFVDSGSKEVVFVNNTVYGNSIQSGSFGLVEPFTEISIRSLGTETIVNNIIVGTSPIPAIGCNVSMTSVLPEIWDHNLIYNGQGPVTAAADPCALDLTRYGNLNVDPQFRAAALADFHLLHTSPAIDAGTDSADGIPAVDIDGTPRPQDSTGKGHPIVDMGAYEAAGLAEVPSTSIVVTPSSSVVGAGTPVTLTAKLTSALGTPTGTVTFFQDGPTVLGEATLNGGQASWTIPTTTPGIHRVYVRYDGQAGFAPGISVYVEYSVFTYQTSLRITASPSATIVLGSPVTFTITSASVDGSIPSPVTLAIDAKQVATLTPDANGISTYTATSLSIGSHTVSAAFAGDSLHGPSRVSLVEEVLLGFPSTISLKSSANPAAAGAAITFTADVAAIKDGPVTPPVGSVVFSEGATTLATETLAPSGASSHAAFTTSSLSLGSHIITATYLPTAVFASSTVSLTQVVSVIVKPDFTLTSPLTLNVVAEHHTSMNFIVTSVNSFSGTVQLSCGNLPVHAVCYFDHGSDVTLAANGTGSVVVDLETSDVKGYKSETQKDPSAPLLAFLFAAACVSSRKRKPYNFV